MRSETIALHGGCDVDHTTRAVAVPIYQTVAYAFDSAEHGAALFNLESKVILRARAKYLGGRACSLVTFGIRGGGHARDDPAQHRD